MKIRVALADDHQLLIEGVKTILEKIEDVEIAATFNRGNDLLNYLEKNEVELVLLDLNMPGQDGLKCLGIIKKLYPPVKVLVLSSYNQPELIAEVKKMNGDGYVVKNAGDIELTHAITELIAGRTFFPEKQASVTSEESYFFDAFLKKFQLTKREVDIIRLICSEMSTKQIAAELFLSEFTVNTHRKNIFRKLGVKNVAGLMNFAKENQLV